MIFQVMGVIQCWQIKDEEGKGGVWWWGGGGGQTKQLNLI